MLQEKSRLLKRRQTPRREPASEAAKAPYPHDLKARIERYLEELRFDREPGTEGLNRAARYSLLAGGKRIRPVLTMATARSLGLDIETVLPTACAIELLHTNSLIADDLPAMDDHASRRGRPVLHRVFGEDVALLAGAALGAEAYRLILERQSGPPERVVAVGREIARMTGAEGMVAGQYLDVTLNGGIDGASLRRLHELKTGALIAAAVSCALLLAGCGGRAATFYRGFALELGVLFQIADDILDVAGSEKTLGKKPGSDKQLGKHTYVSFHGLEEARRLADRFYRAARATLAELGPLVVGPVDDLVAVTDYVYGGVK